MRIIRTEIYYTEDEQDLTPEVLVPAISMVWFPAGLRGWLAGEIDVNELIGKNGLGRFFILNESPESEQKWLPAFVLSAFEGRNWERYVSDAESERVRYGPRWLVEECLDTPMVVESSPPDLVTLRQVLAKGSPAAIGAFVGVTGVGEIYPLMFVSVPFGIIVVGAAVGVSEALRRGLAKQIDQYFKRRLKR
jgi:hypothetical protein